MADVFERKLTGFHKDLQYWIEIFSPGPISIKSKAPNIACYLLLPLFIQIMLRKGHGGMYKAQQRKKVKGYKGREIRSSLLILDLKDGNL